MTVGDDLFLIAHVGHWAVSMIYAAPAVLLAGALGVSTVRQKRRERGRVRRGDEPPA